MPLETLQDGPDVTDEMRAAFVGEPPQVEWVRYGLGINLRDALDTQGGVYHYHESGCMLAWVRDGVGYGTCDRFGRTTVMVRGPVDDLVFWFGMKVAML